MQHNNFSSARILLFMQIRVLNAINSHSRSIWDSINPDQLTESQSNLNWIEILSNPTAPNNEILLWNFDLLRFLEAHPWKCVGKVNLNALEAKFLVDFWF